MSLQLHLPENIPNLVIASTTTITLASTYLGNQTRINIGGQQYKNTSTITLNTGSSGFNGKDSGSAALAAGTLYYIFAVQSGGVLGLTYSNLTAPTGFTSYKPIGRFRTHRGSTDVIALVTRFDNVIRPTADLTWQAYNVDWSGYGGGYDKGNGTFIGKYKRIDENLHCMLSIKFGSTTTFGTAGILVVSIPTIYSVNTSLINFTNATPTGLAVVGSASAIGAGNYYSGNTAINNNPNTVWLEIISAPTTRWGKAYPITWASGDEWSVEAIVPIAEFAGLYT